MSVRLAACRILPEAEAGMLSKASLFSGAPMLSRASRQAWPGMICRMLIILLKGTDSSSCLWSVGASPYSMDRLKLLYCALQCVCKLVHLLQCMRYAVFVDK